jgi:hypothetical protein
VNTGIAVASLIWVVLIVLCLLFLDQCNPLAYIRAYRRRRGGSWCKLRSFLPFVPFVWIRLSWVSERPPDEIWIDTDPATYTGDRQ